MATTFVQSGQEFINSIGRLKKCVFIERVFMGINNDHIDNIYHIKDVVTGKITHVRNEYFKTKKYIIK